MSPVLSERKNKTFLIHRKTFWKFQIVIQRIYRIKIKSVILVCAFKVYLKIFTWNVDSLMRWITLLKDCTIVIYTFCMGTNSFQIFWIACCLKWKLSACSWFVNFRFCKNNLNLCKNRAHLPLLSIKQFFIKIRTNFLSSIYFRTNGFISCWHVFHFSF